MEQAKTSIDNPRSQAIEAMKRSVLPEVWNRNSQFSQSLKTEIQNHPLSRHPILAELNDGSVNLEALRIIHLEYRHAIVQIFTDALTMAQFQSRQLEPRLAPGTKIIPRFLLTLNILDEFGFQPGRDDHEYYRGNPAFAHYPLFEDLLNNLGITQEERAAYNPTSFSKNLNQFLESSFTNYATLVMLLAIAEVQVILFSPALRRATQLNGINVDQGYYFVHGTNSDEFTNAFDDDHEDDLWNALNQACVPEDFERLRKAAIEYMDLWQEFWSHQREISNQHRELKGREYSEAIQADLKSRRREINTDVEVDPRDIRRQHL